MMTTLTHRIRKMPKLGKFLLGILLFFGVFLTSFKLLYAETIPFEDSLPTIFSGWFNSGYYSNTWFKYGGNDFVGIIFRQASQTVSPEVISINSGAQAISCTQKLRGIYYNNQRGRRIRPLDTGNLAILSGMGSGYDTMTMQYGFYTNCTQVSGTFVPALNDVFGQIDHFFSGQDFHMFAGLDYDTGANQISGAYFAHTLKISTGGIHTGFLFDTNGGIAEVDMNTPRCTNFYSSPSHPIPALPTGSNITFTCQGQNVNGYRFQLRASGGTYIGGYTHTNFTGSSDSWFTGSNLPAGDYYASCTVLGPSGVGPQCGSNIPFHLGGTGTTPSSTGCNPNFQGEITFKAQYTGSTVINTSLGTYYSDRTGIIMQRAATEPTHFAVSGDFMESILSGISPYISIFNFSYGPIRLLYTNQRNFFSAVFDTGSCTYTDAQKRVFVDTMLPTTPTVIAPVNGTPICPSAPMTVTWNASYDSGAGLASYTYEIYNNSGMVTGLILSGTVPNTVTSINLNVALLPLGTYYLRILAVDNVGWMSSSAPISFVTSSQYCPAGTGILIVTPVIRLRNVDLSKVYRSDPIRILGLTGPTLVNISKGMLFINDGTGVGTTGMASSHDTLYIELVSSDKYDTTVTSDITVLGHTGTFSVTTKKSECSLTVAEKLTIENIYAELKDEYNGNMSLFSEFLNTFQSMVEDEDEISPNCALEYLLSLIEDEFTVGEGIDTSIHICPNCKQYNIAYDYTQRAYYSPDMANRYYFINRESLIRHLDYYNPGDCHVNTYGSNTWNANDSDPMLHIAPNGKLYHLINQYGGFSATEFAAPKYFDSLQSIIQHIDLKNPPKTIRDHHLDLTFNPIVYAAPNGKEYKVRKALNLGYFSYRLMKVQYFTSLGELKSYINKRNPSKR